MIENPSISLGAQYLTEYTNAGTAVCDSLPQNANPPVRACGRAKNPKRIARSRIADTDHGGAPRTRGLSKQTDGMGVVVCRVSFGCRIQSVHRYTARRRDYCSEVSHR